MKQCGKNQSSSRRVLSGKPPATKDTHKRSWIAETFPDLAHLRGSARVPLGEIYVQGRAARARFAMSCRSFDACIASCLERSFPATGYGLPGAWREFRAMFRKWACKIAAGQGVEAFIAETKAFSSDARRAWVLGTAPSHFIWRWLAPHLRRKESYWAQFSFIGRSLPPGGERHAAEALAGHKEMLTSTFAVDESTLVGLADYAEDWARRFLRRIPDPADLCEPPTGNSATFEKSRADGGFAQCLADLMASDPCENITPPDGLPFGPTQGAVLPLRLIERAAVHQSDGHPPGGRVTVVVERGHKVRVVSAMETTQLVLGHTARRRLMAGMKSEPRIASSLRGDFPGAIDSLNGCAGTVVSSDMKNASDLIPHSVATALVDGLSRSKRLHPVEVMGLRRCVGPQHLFYPDGSDVITTRGILMGLPTTWSLLNLMHLYCWDHAVREYRTSSTSYVHHHPSRCQIFGDDLIGIGPDELIDLYEANLFSVGMKLSPGKHFRSKRRGVFLERLLTFHGSTVETEASLTTRPPFIGRSHGLKFHSWSQSWSVPVKGMVRSSLPGRDDPPLWWSVPLAESALVKEWPARRVVAMRRTMFPQLEQTFRRVGIPPNLPRELGGAGLHCLNDKIDAPSFHRKSLATLAYGGHSETARAYERLWASFAGSPWLVPARQETDTWFSDYVSLPPGQRVGGRIGLYDGERLRTLSTSLNCAAYETFLGRDPDATHYPSLRVLASAVKRLRRDLVAVWPGANPVRKALSVFLDDVAKAQEVILWITTHDPNGFFDDSLLLLPGVPYQRRFRQMVIAGYTVESEMADLISSSRLPPCTEVSGFP
uniref:RNA-dependent RNA polymerase n=1 Tax=Narnavirus I-329 TaxID=2662286 RepID=A0A5P9KF80_9VIRU|nr:RNA-dependent RNA polymerase [Narnavirus I-329]